MASDTEVQDEQVEAEDEAAAEPLPEVDLPDGWTLVHYQPEETVVLSETQGRTQLNAAEYRAEKQINGTMVNAFSSTEEGLQAATEAVDANVQAFHTDPVGAPVAEPVIYERQAIDNESLEIAPEELEVNDKTVITADGAYTEEEWAGRSRTDTIVTHDGQTIFSGVGDDTEQIDEGLAQTAADSQEAENAATAEEPVETDQFSYDTSDALDAPGQSAGGTLVVPAGVESVAQASEAMAETSAEAENERTADTQALPEDEVEDSGAMPGEEDVPPPTAGAQAAAEELGVDLSTVEGTGQGGKITKADVEAAANG